MRTIVNPAVWATLLRLTICLGVTVLCALMYEVKVDFKETPFDSSYCCEDKRGPPAFQGSRRIDLSEAKRTNHRATLKRCWSTAPLGQNVDLREG